MKRLFTLFFVIPLGILVVALAVANRQMVTIALPPEVGDGPLWSFQAPLFSLVLITFIVGLVVGSCVTWVKQGKYRKNMKVQQRHVAQMEVEIEKQQQRVDDLVHEVTHEEKALTALGLPGSAKTA